MRAPPICAARKDPPRCPPNPPPCPPKPAKCPPPPCPPPPPPCPPPPPPRASASSVRRGTTRTSIAAIQAPVVNASALQDWTRRTAAVGWALAYLHEQRASNPDTGSFSFPCTAQCLIDRTPCLAEGFQLIRSMGREPAGVVRFLRLLDLWATV